MARNIERMFDQIDAQDVDGLLSHLADDVTFQFGNAPALNGKNAVKEAVGGFYASILALRHEMTGKWELDDTTIARFRTFYTRHDGHEVEAPCAVILHHATDGRIDDYRIYFDLAPVFAPSATQPLNGAVVR